MSMYHYKYSGEPFKIEQANTGVASVTDGSLVATIEVKVGFKPSYAVTLRYKDGRTVRANADTPAGAIDAACQFLIEAREPIASVEDARRALGEYIESLGTAQ